MTERQAVAETASFLMQADRAGMTERDRTDLVDVLSADPGQGVSLGSGLYKLRVARRGGGKRGGFRTIYFYKERRFPIYLLAAFAKKDKADLSPAELEELRGLARELDAALRSRS